MTTSTSAPPAQGARLALSLGGLAAVGFGIAVLVWPTKAAVALAGVIAAYAIVAGIVYAAIGLLSKGLGVGGRIAHVLLGLLYIAAGAFAFGSLGRSAAFLAVFLTVMVGVMWIVEGFAALFTLGRSDSKVLAIVFALASVIAGFTLLSSPLWGAVFLWWFLGISLVVLGGLNVIRGVAGRRA
ncbi:HdeD family acid-resistance protein [Pseudactinotalea sp. HY158]|uniref:HdeD family acid-resistance protein n=1 Tax=Pseudactinotalea sp. HY158 TaxID=2654547 RepID=UPI00129D0886|nr:DUF308 domain-containing protein [Pseudactinotalea sp. HY158]QGH69995.1 hypothetical protein GCE65_11120 [Pseudactinotalea sp. HY158]